MIPEPVPVLEIDRVSRRYGAVTALDDVSLRVGAGEILAVVGPSGCGKTTLLQVVAGLTRLDGGRVTLAGREVSSAAGTWVPPEQRRVGVVFQDHALFPHLTVAENVEFGLVDLPARQRAERRAEVLAMVRLHDHGDRYPHELSGGEQQRVALARALAPSPALLLFDEPFSSLDANLRVELRSQTAAVLRAAGATAVFVTHDREEALSIGDRVAVLEDGRVEQVDSPEAVFHAPTTRFVARFVGEADLVHGDAVDGTAATVLGPVALSGPARDGPVDVMLRPHELVASVDPEGASEVVGREFRGGHVQLTLRLADGQQVRCDVPHDGPLRPGDRVTVAVAAGHPLAAFSRGAPAGDAAGRVVAPRATDPAAPSSRPR